MASDHQPVRESAIDRAWGIFTSPVTTGVLLAVAGVVCVGVAVAAPVDAGWVEPLRSTYATAVAAGLIGGASVLAAGGFWDRFRSSRAAAGSSELRNRLAPALGAVLVAAGVVMLAGNWFATLRASPPGEMSLSSGETAEAFQGRVAGESVDIMFSDRVALESIDLRGRPTFEIALSRPGEDPYRRTRLESGQVEEVGGYRIAPLALAPDAEALRVTIESTRDETIAATAAEGESIRLRPDGPKYEVQKIVENYLGSLGPAARVKSPDMGAFWVFQRVPEKPEPPEFLHDLRVQNVERAPGAIFSVAPAVSVWPSTAGGLLLLLGFGLVVALPERIRTERRPGEREFASFNDAGEGKREREPERSAVGRVSGALGWTGLVAGAVVLQFAEPWNWNVMPVPVALGMAAAGALAVAPLVGEDDEVVWPAVGASAAVAIVAGAGAVWFAGTASATPWPVGAVFLGTNWAALAASAASALTGALLAGRSGWLAWSGGSASVGALRARARDATTRAVVLLWLSWFAATLVHSQILGSTGFGTRSEWFAFGATLLATGGLLIGWDLGDDSDVNVPSTAGPILVAVVVLAGLWLSFGFGSPFGLSLGS